jgi:hypothetical protein
LQQGYGDQAKFTHADFVQYLQNLDDAASPQPTSSSKARTPTSPEYGVFGGGPVGSSAQSPIVSSGQGHGHVDKAAGVQRTLKAQLADLQLDNKALSEDLRCVWWWWGGGPRERERESELYMARKPGGNTRALQCANRGARLSLPLSVNSTNTRARVATDRLHLSHAFVVCLSGARRKSWTAKAAARAKACNGLRLPP